jgi:hypothetical protein
MLDNSVWKKVDQQKNFERLWFHTWQPTATW